MRNFPCGTKDRNLSGRDLNDAKMGNLVCVHRRAALPDYPESPATNLPLILRARPKMGVLHISVLLGAEKAAARWRSGSKRPRWGWMMPRSLWRGDGLRPKLAKVRSTTQRRGSALICPRAPICRNEINDLLSRGRLPAAAVRRFRRTPAREENTNGNARDSRRCWWREPTKGQWLAG